MQPILNNNTPMDPVLREYLRKHANGYLALGIGLIILGMLAVIFSYMSTLITVGYIGVLMILGGVVEAVLAFKYARPGQGVLHALLSILYFVGGVFILMCPRDSAINLTLLLAIFFIVLGIMRIIYVVTKKVAHKAWVVVNGLVAILLGILILLQWPLSGLWVIGTFVGIDFMIAGWTLIVLSWLAKKPIQTQQ